MVTGIVSRYERKETVCAREFSDNEVNGVDVVVNRRLMG
jgi:hypothetical protein